MNRDHQNRAIAILGFIAILALIAKPVWDGRDQSQFGQGQDDGIYLATAKSLALGEGYRHPNLPGHPYATKYPPLFPLFLSLAWRITPDFPRVLETTSALQAGLLAICLALLFLVLRQMGLSWRRTILASALTFLAFRFVLLAVTLYSEMLFFCLLFAAIWIGERAAERDSRGLALLGGLLTGLAYLARNAALPLLIAAPVFFFLRKRPRLSLYFLALALPFAAGWHVWGALHTAATVRTPYLDEYLRVMHGTGLGAHILEQMSTLSGAVAEMLIPGAIEWLHGIPLHHLVLAAAIAGGIRFGKRTNWPLYLIFTVPYLAMITLWWFQGISRFLIPVWPMLLVGIIEEGSHFEKLCAASIKRPGLRRLPHCALLALAIAIAIRNEEVTRHRTAFVYATERENLAKDRQVFDWIAAHAGPDAIVLAWKEGQTYLYTGLPTSHELYVAAIPQTEELTGLRPAMAVPAGQFKSLLLLLLASDSGRGSGSQLAMLRAQAESLPGSRLEFSSPDALVYRLPPPIGNLPPSRPTP